MPPPAFAALLASLPSVSPHTSPRLRRGIALRALDAVFSLSDADAAILLRKARAVLADPDLASCFPDRLTLPVARDDEAAVVDLKRLVDVEWADLPPSTLEIAADRIAGDGALHTWADADQDTRKKLRLLVGESMELDILGKLGQGPSKVGADEADLTRESGKSGHAQEGCSTPHQQDPAKTTTDAPKLVTSATIKGKDKATSSYVTGLVAPDNHKTHPVTGSKRGLMERNRTATVYEWDDSGDSDHERVPHKRQLPTYKKKPEPSFPHKSRKKWSEMQEKSLMEGVEKYGKGNWKEIKIAYPDVFEDRSTVDMKDKFRNMERH